MNMLAWLRRFFTRAPKAAPAPWLGVTLDALPSLLDPIWTQSARPLLVRTHNVGDAASAERVLGLLAAGRQVLSVIPFSRGFGPIGPGMALQIDDAPDAQSPAVSPEHYGETFRLTMASLRETLPASIPIVTAGFSINASVEWMQRALVAGAGDADAICFHVGGTKQDLVLNYHDRFTAVTKAFMLARLGPRPLWITHVDLSQTHASTLAVLFAQQSLRLIARVYLSDPPASMLDVITAAQQRRRA